MRFTHTLKLTLAACALLGPAFAGAQALVTERSVSLNAALELATASLERCRADGYKVTITVLNRHARTALVLSDDGVNPHTIENSMRKAYTAFTTRSSSLIHIYTRANGCSDYSGTLTTASSFT